MSGLKLTIVEQFTRQILQRKKGIVRDKTLNDRFINIY